MTDYNNLLDALPRWAENDTAEFAEAIPDMVRFAEAKIYRAVKVQGFEKTVPGNLVVGTPRIAKPADLIQPRYLKITLPTGRETVLELKQLEFLFEYWAVPTDTMQPRYYAVEKEGFYRIAPTPDLALPYELGYLAKPAPLSVDNPINWLTKNAYDCLFAACMCEAAAFVLDDRQTSILSIWQPKYDLAVKEINAVDLRAERDDYRVPYVMTDNV